MDIKKCFQTVCVCLGHSVDDKFCPSVLAIEFQSLKKGLIVHYISFDIEAII